MTMIVKMNNRAPNQSLERGDIVLIKTRPSVIVSNNLVNKITKLATIIPITSQNIEQIRSFEVLLDDTAGLTKKSKAIILQVRTIDKSRIQKKLGKVSKKNLNEIEVSLKIHFAIV